LRSICEATNSRCAAENRNDASLIGNGLALILALALRAEKISHFDRNKRFDGAVMPNEARHLAQLNHHRLMQHVDVTDALG